MTNASSTRSAAITGRSSRAGSVTGIRAVVEFARNLDLIQTVSLLTLVLTVIFSFDHWLFHIISRTCFLIFILRPSSLRRPQFWFALALAGTITIILAWEQVDNHKYLLVYWTWVLFVLHLFSQPDQPIRILLFNARFFFCFLFSQPTFRRRYLGLVGLLPSWVSLWPKISSPISLAFTSSASSRF